MKKLSLFFALLFSVQNVLAGAEKSTTVPIASVTSHRMHSVTHQLAGAHNLYLVYVSGLQEGCTKLYLFADKDPYLFSSVISGLSSQKTSSVLFYYHTDDSARGPWGDTSACRISSFTVMPG